MPQETVIKRGFSSNTLKLIAIIAMTVDHVLWCIWPGYDNGWAILLLHAVGRITAPIMCFMIAEGFHHTRDLKKYIIRMFAFAVISHFAYCFAFGIPMLPFKTGVFNQTGVMWSLAWGLVLLAVMRSEKLGPLMQAAVIIGVCIISFPADWSCIAAMVVMMMGAYRGDFRRQMIYLMIFVAMYSAVFCVFIDVQYGLLQLCVALAIPLLKQYNGSRGKWKGMKWFFYIYYPAHLVACGMIRLLLHGNVGMMVGGG